MNRGAPRRKLSKELLIRDSLRGVEAKAQRDHAWALLTGRVPLPAGWLTQEHRHFISLKRKSIVAGCDRELVISVVQLCELIHFLIDDFLVRNASSYAFSTDERTKLHDGAAVAVVREAIFRRANPWPTEVRPRMRKAADRALRQEIESRRAGDSLPMPRGRWSPVDDRDLEERKFIRATSTESGLRRSVRYLWHKELSGVVKPVVMAPGLAALYLLVFFAVRHFGPDLTVEQSLWVAGTALGTVLGGGGLGLAAQMLRARGVPNGRWGGAEGMPRESH